MPNTKQHGNDIHTQHVEDMSSNPDTSILIGYLKSVSLEKQAKVNLSADVKRSIKQFDYHMKEIEGLILCSYAHTHSQYTLHLDPLIFNGIRKNMLQAYQEASRIISWCYAAKQAAKNQQKRSSLFVPKKHISWSMLQKIQQQYSQSTAINSQMVRNEYNYLLHSWLAEKAGNDSLIALTHFFHSQAIFDLEELGFFYSDTASLHPEVDQLAEKAMLIENMLSLIRLFRSVSQNVFSEDMTPTYYKKNTWHERIRFENSLEELDFIFPTGRNLSSEQIIPIIEIRRDIGSEQAIKQHLQTHPQIKDWYAPNILALCETMWDECIHTFAGIFAKKQTQRHRQSPKKQAMIRRYKHVHSSSLSSLSRLSPQRKQDIEPVYTSGVSDNMVCLLEKKSKDFHLKIGRLNLQWQGSARPAYRNQPSANIEKNLKKTTQTNENINRLLNLQTRFLQYRNRYRHTARAIGIVASLAGAVSLVGITALYVLPQAQFSPFFYWPTQTLQVMGGMAVVLLILGVLTYACIPMGGRLIQYLYVQGAQPLCDMLTRQLRNTYAPPKTHRTPYRGKKLNTHHKATPLKSSTMTLPLTSTTHGLPIIPDNATVEEFTTIQIAH